MVLYKESPLRTSKFLSKHINSITDFKILTNDTKETSNREIKTVQLTTIKTKCKNNSRTEVTNRRGAKYPSKLQYN